MDSFGCLEFVVVVRRVYIQAGQQQLVPVVVVVPLDDPGLPDNMALHYYLSLVGTEVVAQEQAEAQDDWHCIQQSSTDHTEVEHPMEPVREHWSARFLRLLLERWLQLKNPF